MSTSILIMKQIIESTQSNHTLKYDIYIFTVHFTKIFTDNKIKKIKVKCNY